MKKSARDYPRALCYVPEWLLPDLISRSDKSDDPKAVRSGSAYGNTLRRDVVRYYNLLRRELMALRLTQAEAVAICRALQPHLEGVAKRQSLQALGDHLGVSRQRVWQMIKAANPRVQEAMDATGIRPAALRDDETDSRQIWRDLDRLVPEFAGKRLSESQALAIVDAVERLFRKHRTPTVAALREAGLLV